MIHSRRGVGRRPRLLPALLALAALAGAAALLGCGGEADHQAATVEPTVVVRAAVATAERTEVASEREITGTIEPWQRVSPGTKILGRIDRFLVQEGDAVRAGQALVRIESRDLEAAVAQAEAAIAMAEARLENARTWHDRMVRLHERGSATEKALEDAVAGLRVAEAGLEQARADRAGAAVTLEYARIDAPIAGWVTARRAEAGDMASPGMPLLVIEDLSRVKMVARVPEGDLVGVTVGTPVLVRIDVLERDLPGQIDAIVPAGDASSRTFAVKVHLDNADGRIRSGMFARVLLPGESRPVLAVPATAIVSRGQLTGVWVVEDGLARLRWIRPGRRIDDRIEVLSGLDAGERYLPDPPAGIADAARVEEI